MCVFARFKLFACFQFDFSSGNDNIILFSDWPLGLLRFEFLTLVRNFARRRTVIQQCLTVHLALFFKHFIIIAQALQGT